MASMSYCVFENTADDLQRCIFAMEDYLAENQDLTEFLNSRSSPEERKSVYRLVQLCNDYLDAYDQLMER